jgi:hypothetical protein
MKRDRDKSTGRVSSIKGDLLAHEDAAFSDDSDDEMLLTADSFIPHSPPVSLITKKYVINGHEYDYDVATAKVKPKLPSFRKKKAVAGDNLKEESAISVIGTSHLPERSASQSTLRSASSETSVIQDSESLRSRYGSPNRPKDIIQVQSYTHESRKSARISPSPSRSSKPRPRPVRKVAAESELSTNNSAEFSKRHTRSGVHPHKASTSTTLQDNLSTLLDELTTPVDGETVPERVTKGKGRAKSGLATKFVSDLSPVLQQRRSDSSTRLDKRMEAQQMDPFTRLSPLRKDAKRHRSQELMLPSPITHSRSSQDSMSRLNLGESEEEEEDFLVAGSTGDNRPVPAPFPMTTQDLRSLRSSSHTSAMNGGTKPSTGATRSSDDEEE